MSRLESKVAVVIGGGSGIGAAISERFAKEGASVYATSRKVSDEEARGRQPLDPGSIQPVRPMPAIWTILLPSLSTFAPSADGLTSWC
nr:SDR family NAD(P)-dependent oxidoreductase [Rhizobium leguminosarum]